MISTNPARLTSISFFVIGLVILFLTRNFPLMDFGNYYYGSKLLLDGKFTLDLYTGFEYFNEQIADYGEKNFLENYIPVPPFSALFYIPFAKFSSLSAKLFFNVFSLLAFGFALYRLLLHLKINNKWVVLLPFVFIFPLYNNLMQGQAYLLVCAFLFESFVSSEKGNTIYPSFLLALAGQLKLLPLFILLYFVLKKNYKVVFYTFCFFVALSGITLIIIPPKIVFYYISHILPRLFNNDIIGPYWYGNQSVYTALLNLFSYDTVNNPYPVLESKTLIVLIESMYISIVLLTIYALRKENNFLFFSFLTFGLILIGRYNTSYAMLYLYLMPLVFYLDPKKRSVSLIAIAFIAVTVSWPMGGFASVPFFMKFLRLWSVLLLLFLFFIHYQIKLKPVLLLLITVFFFLLKYFTFSIQPVNYFYLQNSKGILINAEIQSDSLMLESTMGAKTIKEKFKVNGHVKTDTALFIKDNLIYFNNKIVCSSKENKQNPFLYNDTSIVFMSDLNQGICFYKLRVIPIHE